MCRVNGCDPTTRLKLLLKKFKQPEVPGPAIVYVTLQRTAEEVSEKLIQVGLPARAYHAGLDDNVRSEVQDWFMASSDGIVVATIAFGMGIDKANVRAIYHYNPAKSIENLAQEIGRAGRDGETSVCETLLVHEDRIVLENFAYGDTPSLVAVRRFVELLRGQPENFFVSYYSLAYETDMRDTVVRSLLTYLELQGVLESTASRYENYKFKPLVASTDILKHFEGERREFASSVLALSWAQTSRSGPSRPSGIWPSWATLRRSAPRRRWDEASSSTEGRGQDRARVWGRSSTGMSPPGSRSAPAPGSRPAPESARALKSRREPTSGRTPSSAEGRRSDRARP